MRFCRKSLKILLLTMALVACSVAAPNRPAHGQHAMVATVHELASQVGVDTMKQGGNAVDAAVAVGFALAVVHPQAGNIGGGGFMMFRTPTGEYHFVDFREKAPAAATATMYVDKDGNVVPDLSTVGYKAISVPGSVAGLAYAEKKWGKLSLAQVMAPAIKLARDGFVLSYEDAHDMQHSDHMADFSETRRIFQRDGRYYQQGDIFRQPELAKTLERIAKNPDDFYHGALARELAAAIQKGGGLVTEKDLASYEVKERAPIRGSYRGYEIVSAPPPSSGGIALIESLNILEGYDLKKYGSRSAESMHLTVEAFRRAYYDRSEFLGDPDFAQIPVAQLIDKKYGKAWRSDLNPEHATVSKGLERPAGFGELDKMAALLGPPVPYREPEHTTHYSIVAPDGGAVAVTPTLNDSFGPKVTAEGLGFLLNDEMDDFSSAPGVPNGFGLIQGEANAVGPQKRPLSAMTPTIVTKDGKLFMVTGSPGGSTIITTVANILMGVVDYGMNIQQAVNAPRFHHQWMPDEIWLEAQGFSPDSEHLLEQMGHKLRLETSWHAKYWGDAESVMIDLNTGERLGATDARNNGKAMGY